METFAQRVQEWQTFYATMAGVSATLVGLLFVALYMNVDTFIKTELQYLKRLARMVFGSFILVLFSSLMFIIPHQSQWGLGTPLFCAAAIGLSDCIYALVDVRRHRQHISRRDFKRMNTSMVRAFVGRGALMVASLLLFSDNSALFYWMAGTLIASLLTACTNCWDLLVGTRERMQH